MKIRNGFISNSSSSSFIVNLNNISKQDLDKIQEYGMSDKNDDNWYFYIENDCLTGYTSMDNGIFDEFIRENSINTGDFKWSN